MTQTAPQGGLELHVTDFGPIVEARVDLRPLTVFVGPSNTGKSYLAILIYALHRFFDSEFGQGRPPGKFSRRSRTLWEQKDSQDFVDLIGETIRPLLDENLSVAGGDISLPKEIMDYVRVDLEASTAALGSEICRCFGIDDVRTLIRRGQKKGVRVGLRNHPSDGGPVFEHVLRFSANSMRLKAEVPTNLKVTIASGNDGSIDEITSLIQFLGSFSGARARKGSEHYVARRVLEAMGDLVLPVVTGLLRFPAVYLPADRTGVMHAHNVVVRALIRAAPTAGLRPDSTTPMLSGVLVDFLEQLVGMGTPRGRRRPRRRDLGTGIEDSILSGSVRVDSSEIVDYPTFTYRPKGWDDDLPLKNASSMVSELAPVVLYLRHVVTANHVLIVEEPESHLHPGMQVQLIRELALLVKAGVRVIITTHSEWLLEELANIVRRSELPADDDTAESSTDIALGAEQVGAWLFEPRNRPKGSVVREIGLEDTGLFPAGFDDVAAALHNDWANISSKIEDNS